MEGLSTVWWKGVCGFQSDTVPKKYEDNKNYLGLSLSGLDCLDCLGLLQVHSSIGSDGGSAGNGGGDQ